MAAKETRGTKIEKHLGTKPKTVKELEALSKQKAVRSHLEYLVKVGKATKVKTDRGIGYAFPKKVAKKTQPKKVKSTAA